MFERILVGVDGSPHSLRAAKLAGQIARTMNSDLYLVVAYDPIPRELGEPFIEEVISNRLISADELYKTALQECGDTPGKVIKEILEGPPAEAILAILGTHEIDLVIMGTRGLGKVASIFLGSQSRKVVAESNIPVLLVK